MILRCIFSGLLLFVALTTNAFALCSPPVCEVLQFEPAYQNLLEHTFELKMAEAGVGIREGERWQAARRPNPLLTVEFDSLRQQKSGNCEENELFIGLTQLLELGGKRRARERVAEAAQTVSSWDIEIVKCDLYAALLYAFIDVAMAQERLQVANDLLSTAEEGLSSTRLKASNGKGSSIDIKKVEISHRMAALSQSRRRADLVQAKIRLRSLWDDIGPQFESVMFPIYELCPPPSYSDLACELEANPTLSKSYAELRKAWEIVAWERSRRFPDLAVQVAVNTERFYRDPSLFVGFQIPLPINDRNQGNICRAEHERNQILFKQLDIASHLNSKLELSHQEWCTAFEQAKALQELVTTAAAESYQLANESYQAGKVEYLALLDARSTFYGLKMQYLDVLEEYHRKRADTLKLTAKCCPALLTPQEF